VPDRMSRSVSVSVHVLNDAILASLAVELFSNISGVIPISAGLKCEKIFCAS